MPAPNDTPLGKFLLSLPKGLSGAQISRRAMGFLLQKQYEGKQVPDCASVRDLMAS